MSKIKVDTIQSTQHATSTIGLTSTGATINGDCNATTFTGSGANLTNLPVDLTQLDAANLTSGTIPNDRFPATLPTASGANLTSLPSANLTGALPALDGSALTGIGGGGGSLEFVKKVQSGSAVSSIVETGLDYDRVYRLVFPSLGVSSYGGIRLSPHVDNSSTPHNNSDCNQGYTNSNGSYGQNGANNWNMYPSMDRNYNMAIWELYTGERAWMTWHYYTFGTSTEYNGWVHGYGWKVVASNTNNDSNQTGSFAKVNGFTIEDIYGANIIPATKLLIYKYKES